MSLVMGWLIGWFVALSMACELVCVSVFFIWWLGCFVLCFRRYDGSVELTETSSPA